MTTLAKKRRQRQNEARRARERYLRAVRRRQRRRRQVLAAVAVIAVISMVGSVFLFAGGEPERSSEPAPPSCPPGDGSAERTVKFSAPPPTCIDPAKSYRATVETDLGRFVIQLDEERAPQTVNNFVFLARYHFYDGVPFHRVVPGFVVQGGDGERGDGSGGPGYTIPDELPEAGPYEVGAVAMANTGRPDSGGSQFFVVTGPQGTALPPQYALFCSVVEGLEVLSRIEADGSPDPEPPKVLHRIERVTIADT